MRCTVPGADLSSIIAMINDGREAEDARERLAQLSQQRHHFIYADHLKIQIVCHYCTLAAGR
jgi:hypothetical protein